MYTSLRNIHTPKYAAKYSMPICQHKNTQPFQIRPVGNASLSTNSPSNARLDLTRWLSVVLVPTVNPSAPSALLVLRAAQWSRWWGPRAANSRGPVVAGRVVATKNKWNHSSVCLVNSRSSELLATGLLMSLNGNHLISFQNTLVYSRGIFLQYAGDNSHYLQINASVVVQILLTVRFVPYLRFFSNLQIFSIMCSNTIRIYWNNLWTLPKNQ